MAEVTIRLRHNPKTGERVVIIHYESEDDALPHEHERDHRQLAEELLGRPLDEVLGAASVDRVIVRRNAAGEEVAEELPEAEVAGARAAEKNRG
jgi:hypothetical protein